MGRPPALRRARGLASALLILSMVSLGACRSDGSRPLADSEFKVSFGTPKIPRQMAAGTQIIVDVGVRNDSAARWPSRPDARGRNAVHLAYHWTTEQDDLVIYDGRRTALPRDIDPGGSVVLKTLVQAPERTGRYLLEMTLVQEGVAWFPDKGGAKISIPVTVIEAVAAPRVRQRHTSFGPRPVTEPAAGRQPAGVRRPAGAAPEAGGSPVEAALAHREFWSVQVASLSRQDGSEDLARALRNKGYDAYVASANIEGRELYRVHVGRLSTRTEAEKLKELLQDTEKLEHSFVVHKS